MKNFYAPIILIASLLIVTFLGISGFLEIKEAQTGASDNAQGWAWSDNIGWISFNNLTDGSSYNYGVNISDTGIFSGYAWSDNIGWISFNRVDTGAPPEAPDYGTHLAETSLDTGQVSGWARALSCGDGWDGWIKLRDAGDGYGVYIDNDPASATYQQFFDWAWGSNVVGWINFDQVTTSFEFIAVPSLTNLDSSFVEPCAQSRVPILSWDTDAEIPYDYQLQIDNNSDFSSPIISDQELSTDSTFWGPEGCYYCCQVSPYDNIAWGGSTYYWQVKARNADGNWSGWATSSFETKEHCYPYPEFLCNDLDCSTVKPTEEEAITLSDDSTVYGGATITNCAWVLPSGSTPISGDPAHDCQITVKFAQGANQEIILTVTDSSGYSCSGSQEIDVRLPLPEWEEVTPF